MKKDNYYENRTRYNENKIRRRTLSYLYSLLLILVFQVYKVNAQSTFGNVAFGGGGFITGIINHKTSGDVYCRTDVGGAYRWDAANSKWIPLLDWNSEDETTYQGIEALALDPQNANNLYLFAGTSYFNGGKTAILKSTDKGNTFTIVDVTSKFKTHANALGRANGERLAVDPNNGNVLFCGTKANGLWKSTDAGLTWNLAWNGVTTTSNGNGISFVLFEPSSASGGVTKTIYIGVSRTGAGNIYKSTDGGSTFTAIQADNSFMPHRAVLSSDNSTLYVSMANEQGPSNGNSGRVYKLATATGTWTNITPEGNNYPYGGVSVDPTNKNRVIVSTVNVWDNNQFCNNVWGDRIYLSTDGGSTWTSKLTCTSTLDPNGIGWIAPYGIHWADCIDFDPVNTAKVRVMSGNGLFTCDDINASAVSWKFDVKGLEETVPLDAISIPGGPLILGVGDQHGAVYTDIYAYPTQIINPSPNAISGIAYAGNNTSKVVMVTNNKINYSTDQGATFPTSATVNGTYGKVALSADGSTTLHCPGGSSTTYYSTNNGATWTSTGVTNVQDVYPIADYVNANKFYIYNPGSGQLLVSTNKGVSFTASSSDPGTGGSIRPTAVPGNEGHVWVALPNGLTYTTNSGTSWTTVPNVTYCKAVGFGKAATGATYHAVYIWGTVSGVKGIFRSTDQGATWTRINDDAHEWGGVGNGNFVMGDMNVYGRAYMGTVGRGMVVIESGGSCTPTAITPNVQINGGAWTQTANVSVNLGDSVLFGPQPATGGSWSWSGPNGFMASTREITISNIQTNQVGNYVATYTNDTGCQSTQTFVVTVIAPCAPTAITPYVQVNGGTWQQTANVSVASGDSVIFGPQPVTGGSWNWSGPNGFTASTREITISNIQTNQAGDYVATYTNDGGCQSTQTHTLTVTGGGSVATTTHVQSIVTGTANAGRGKLRGTATVTIYDDLGNAVSGATVTGTFSGTFNETVSAVTGSNGTVLLSTIGSAKGSLTVDLCVTNVIHNSLTYAPAQDVITCTGAATARLAAVYESATSIKNEDKVSVEIYPNPSHNGVFQLNIPWEDAKTNIVIFDINGKQVYEQSVTGKEQVTINSKLGNGFYIVKIQSDKATVTRKLIVE